MFQNFEHFITYFFALILLFMQLIFKLLGGMANSVDPDKQLIFKLLGGMANSVDPDQTAPSGAVWSGSALFAYAILSDTLVYKILGHLRYA